MTRWCCAVLLAALMSGCTSTPQQQPGWSPLPLLDHPSALVEAVPFYPQTDDQCGPAALASVLQHRGVSTTPEALRSTVYLKERGGSLQSDLIAATRAQGLVPFTLPPSLDDLLRELAAGNPVLVLQNLSFDWAPQWHYSVAIGYDADSNELILHSGPEQALRRPLAQFERLWSRAQRWALVIVPPDQPAASATPDRWLSSLLALEQTGQTQAVETGYRDTIRRWPDFANGWNAWANARYAAGDFQAALRGYQQSLRIDRRQTRAWNNQAYALDALDCGQQAIASLHCGLRIEFTRELLDSLNDLRDAHSRQRSNCPIILCF